MARCKKVVSPSKRGYHKFSLSRRSCVCPSGSTRRRVVRESDGARGYAYGGKCVARGLSKSAAARKLCPQGTKRYMITSTGRMSRCLSVKPMVTYQYQRRSKRLGLKKRGSPARGTRYASASPRPMTVRSRAPRSAAAYDVYGSPEWASRDAHSFVDGVPVADADPYESAAWASREAYTF